jgi:hypothetical protein
MRQEESDGIDTRTDNQPEGARFHAATSPLQSRRKALPHAICRNTDLVSLAIAVRSGQGRFAHHPSQANQNHSSGFSGGVADHEYDPH